MKRPIPFLLFIGTLLLFSAPREMQGQVPFGPANYIRVDTFVQSRLPFPVPVDVDSDGDLDVIADDHYAGDGNSDRLYIFINDGNGDLTETDILFVDYDVSTAVEIQELQASDLDGDGDVDLFLRAFTNFLGFNEKTLLLFFLNDGDGHFIKDQEVEFPNIYRRADLIDFDHDGFKDLIIPANNVLVYFRNDGTGHFTLESTYGIDALPQNFTYTDVTGDGDWDIVFASQAGIRWYENEGDSLFSLTFISPEHYGVVDTVTDMDGNGLADLIVRTYFSFNADSELSIFYQQAPGAFLQSSWQVPAESERTFLRVDDISGSALPDIMLTNILSDSIFWYENLGPATTPQLQVAVRDLIQNDDPFQLADLNADGAPDILMNMSDVYPGWIPSESESVYGAPRTFVELSISHSIRNVLELNGDPDPDLVIYREEHWGYSQLPMLGYISQGSATYSQVEVPHSIGVPTYYYKLNRHRFADIDGDGDPDEIGGFRVNDPPPPASPALALFWSENMGDGTFGPVNIIDSTRWWYGPAHVFDSDDDGDVDLIAMISYYDTDLQQTVRYLAWYQNDGAGNFSGQLPVDIDMGRPLRDYARFYPADVDLDGIQDLVFADGYQSDEPVPVTLFRGNGDGTFGDSTLLFYTEFNSVWGNFGEIHDIDDFNQDGVPDFLVTISESVMAPFTYVAELRVYASNDSSGSWEMAWSKGQEVVTPNGWSVVTADFDDDGDPDIIAKLSSLDYSEWVENLGDGSYAPAQPLVGGLYGKTDLFAADMNGDALPDLITTSYPDFGSFWFENLLDDSLAFVSGRVYWDRNDDSLFNGGDKVFPGIALTMEPSGQQFYTGADGRFRAYTNEPGTHELSVVTAPFWFDCEGILELTPLLPAVRPFEFGFQPFVQIEQDFSYTDESDCRELSGRVFSDANGNGTWDAGEESLGGVRIYADVHPYPFFRFTRSEDGYYYLSVDPVDTVRVDVDPIAVFGQCLLEPLTYTQTYPADEESYIVLPGTNDIDTLDFGVLVDTGSVYDAGIYTLGVVLGDEAGETFPAWLDFKSTGDIEDPCRLRITHSPLVSLIDSDIPPMIVNDTWVEWLFPVGSAPYSYCMGMTWQIDDEAVQGDTLHWEASYGCPPGEDACPGNNLVIRDVVLQSGPVRMANEPAALYSMRPEGEMPEVIDRDAYLSYVLYFQNPLPVTAYNVTILYDLPDALDPASVSRPFSSFPGYDFRLNGDGQMIISMDNIRLPDAESDPAGSYGFLQFNVRLKDGLPDGTVIPLEAYVLFNGQHSEMSNEVIHRLGSATAVFDPVAENGAAVYPNPFREEAVFEWKQPVDFAYDIVLTDLPGRQVMAVRNRTGQQVILNADGLAAGWYLLNVYSSEGRDLLGSFPVVVE